MTVFCLNNDISLDDLDEEEKKRIEKSMKKLVDTAREVIQDGKNKSPK